MSSNPNPFGLRVPTAADRFADSQKDLIAKTYEDARFKCDLVLRSSAPELRSPRGSSGRCRSRTPAKDAKWELAGKTIHLVGVGDARIVTADRITPSYVNVRESNEQNNESAKGGVRVPGAIPKTPSGITTAK